MSYIDIYPMSVLIYCTVVISALILAYYCEKIKSIIRISKVINIKVTSIYLFFIIILISILPGLRGMYVGIDTYGYITRVFLPLKDGYFEGIYSPTVFKLFSKIILIVFNEPQVVILLISIITNTLIILGFWRLKNDSSFFMMIYVYLTFYYFFTFNTFRQFMGVAIVFFAFKVLRERKYVGFILYVIFATLLHSSCILAIAFIPIYIILTSEEKKDRKIRKYFILGLPIFIIFSYILLINLVNVEHYVYLYDRYGDIESAAGIGFMMPVKIFLALFIFFIVKKNRLVYTTTKCYNFFAITTIIGLCLASLTYFIQFAERFSFSFILFEGVFIGTKLKDKKIESIIRVIYFLLGVYAFYISLKRGSQGVMPYYFYWEKM